MRIMLFGVSGISLTLAGVLGGVLVTGGEEQRTAFFGGSERTWLLGAVGACGLVGLLAAIMAWIVP